MSTKSLINIKANHLDLAIKEFVALYEQDLLHSEEARELYRQLQQFGREHKQLDSPEKSRVYELQALILDSLGHQDRAYASIKRAKNYLPQEEDFVTEWAFMLSLQSESGDILNYQKAQVSTHVGQNNRKPFYKRKLLYAGIALIILLAWGPVSDWYTVESAPESAKELAKNLNLTSEGRKILLLNHPTLIDAATMETKCPQKGSGVPELGCYIPSESTIYIRSMPDELKSEEKVTAAHEMLHAAYQGLSENERLSVDEMVETEFNNLNNDTLNKTIASYGEMSKDEKDNELHSFLGSEYSVVSGKLNNYFSKYFIDRTTELQLAENSYNVFKGYDTQLANLGAAIDQIHARAESYYLSHSRAARYGDAYYANYYYNLYSNTIDQLNSDVNEYNAILENYKILVDGYFGQEYSSQEMVTTTN